MRTQPTYNRVKAKHWQQYLHDRLRELGYLPPRLYFMWQPPRYGTYAWALRRRAMQRSIRGIA